MKNQTHFLLVGNSHGHIFKIMDHFHPERVILITSPGCHSTTSELMDNLKIQGIEVYLQEFEVFSKETPFLIENFLQEEILRIRKQSLDEEIWLGFTGGTNLMVAGMSIAAQNLHLNCHYVVEFSGEILIFSF